MAKNVLKVLKLHLLVQNCMQNQVRQQAVSRSSSILRHSPGSHLALELAKQFLHIQGCDSHRAHHNKLQVPISDSRWEVTLENICPVCLGGCSARALLLNRCLLPEIVNKTWHRFNPSDLQEVRAE